METTLGQIELFPYGFTPSGFMSCEGQTLNIASYNALYSLLGTYYGGDGKTTFCLPNLLGTEPVPNMQYYIAIEGYYPQRS